MTTTVPSPKAARRSRRIYVLWAVALALLLLSVGVAWFWPREVSASGLSLSLEGTRAPEQGLPQDLKVTFTNISGRPAWFTPPRPACPEAADGAVPFPVLGIRFAEFPDDRMVAVYTDTTAKTTPGATRLLLSPGRQWKGEYPFRSFFFYGPCGPADNVTRYFRPGRTPLTLTAVLLLSEADPTSEDRELQASSGPIRVHCEVPADMLTGEAERLREENEEIQRQNDSLREQLRAAREKAK